ncbi:MAG: sugar ABC transporter substrate-binding protein [Treponema sp.]|jgi:multiple sugar transport system substrate-binding protein|nr:sugar ABC transporter substrate-binding protein [Treponema sp.]
MKTKVKRIVCAVLTALVMGGCQGKQAISTGTAVSLKVGIWDSNQEGGITGVLKIFIQETGINAAVEVTPWNEYWTLLEAAATGGSLPDVFWMHSNQAQRYGTNGMLLDLTDRVATSNVANMANFPADLVNLYTFSGKHYAIPKDMDTIALWYNKTIFDEVGLAYPNENWTWDDLKSAARKLTDASKNRYGIDFRPGEPQTEWANAIYQNGGFVISNDKKKSGFDNPATIAAFEYMVGFVQEGIAPPLAITADNDVNALFQSGIIAMGQFGSWSLSSFKANDYIRQNCDVAVLPASPTGKRATIYNGLGWAAAAGGKHPEEAWKLLEFFSREDIQRRLSESGIAMSAYNGTAAPFVQGFPEFNVKAYIDQLPDAVFRPYSKNTVVWEEMAIQALNDAWSGARPVAAVCRDIAQRMNVMLAAE